jgi:hypothetical protein
VNARKKTNIPKAKETGMAILNDFDKKIYENNPPIRQAIPVRVPEGKRAQMHIKPVSKKNILCFLILLVIPKTINATAVEAMPIPKLAASLNVEKYLMRVPPCMI